MSFTIRRVEYFYTTVQDQPGEAYKLLSHLADAGINLLALAAVPVGPMRAHFTLFPEDHRRFMDAAGKAGLAIDGPHGALLVQGSDALAGLTEVHEKLYRAGVNVYASTGVADGRGSYGYVVYVRPEEYDRAAQALEVLA